MPAPFQKHGWFGFTATVMLALVLISHAIGNISAAPPPVNRILMGAKLNYQELPQGARSDFPGDMKAWEKEATARLDDGVIYITEERTFDDAQAFIANRVPMLYLTGDGDFKLTDEQRRKLAKYVEEGGMIVLNSTHGGTSFTAAARREMQSTLKDSQFQKVPEDHSIYATRYRLASGTVLENGKTHNGAFDLEMIQIKDRAAVVLVPYGLGPALTGLAREAYDAQGTYYLGETGYRIAINIAAYALNNADLTNAIIRPVIEKCKTQE